MPGHTLALQVKDGFINGFDRRWTMQWCVGGLFVISMISAALIIGLIMLPFLAANGLKQLLKRAKSSKLSSSK